MEIKIKNLPLGDQSGAAKKAEDELNLLLNDGFEIRSTNTSVIALGDKNKDIIILTVILSK